MADTRARGYFPLYRVEKRSIDTIHMEKYLGEALKSRVSTSGLKDKRSVAVQFATPTSTRADDPQKVEHEHFRAVRVGYVSRPLTRGSNTANRFTVVVRDGGPEVSSNAMEAFALAERMKLPNFYGLQRFGGGGTLTSRIGRAIVGRNFEEAVGLLLFEPRSADGDESSEARKMMREGRLDEGSIMLPPSMDIERAVARRLAKGPGAFVDSLRAVPIRVRRLYTQAFQSYLFNRTLSEALEAGVDISAIESGDNWGEAGGGGLFVSKVHGVREPFIAGAFPLIQLAGFACRNYGSRFDGFLFKVMDEEGVGPKDFYVEELQEVSVEGGFRRPAMVVRNPEAESQPGGTTVRFTLGRGSYATVLLREVLKPVDPSASGFT